MISSKDMFFDIRSEEMQTIYAPDFTKKQAEQTGIALIDRMFSDGNQTPVQFYSNIARLKAVIDAADRAFRDRVNAYLRLIAIMELRLLLRTAQRALITMRMIYAYC
jgi:hypothetical protein